MNRNVATEYDFNYHAVGISSSEQENRSDVVPPGSEERLTIRDCYDHNFVRICEAIPIPTKAEIFQDCFARTIRADVMESHESDTMEATNVLEAKAMMPPTTHFDGTYGAQETLLAYARPMFIYCHTFKNSKDCRLGLHIQYEHDAVKICRIDADSLLDSTKCLRPGDQLIAINGCSLRTLNRDQIHEFIQNATGSISFTVRNQYGDPNIVLSSVQKASSLSKVGLAFRNDWTDGAKLIVSSIHEESPFRSSLLCVGQQIISIQDVPCSNLSAAEAAELCRESSTCSNGNQVAIISTAKAATNVATVLCCEVKRINSNQSKFQRFSGLRIFPSDLSFHAKSLFSPASKKRVGLAIPDSFGTIPSE